tara:strand:- start:2056 stop:3405 length:1350 start_codon:yes stop_codon:yes gene_type:complete
MKDILQSYSGKELRRFVIEHNKKVKAKVRLEVKEIKERILKKRLIDIRGLKKDSIIEKMMEQQVFFKNIKMRKEDEVEEKTKEQVKESSDKLQIIYNEIVNTYEKNQDEKELAKELRKLRKLADKEGLKTDDFDPKKIKTRLDKIIKNKNQPKKIKKTKIEKLWDESLEAPLPEEITKRDLPKKKKLKIVIKKPEGTHKMPDGTVMSGETHTEDSKPVKPKKKKLIIKEKSKIPKITITEAPKEKKEASKPVDKPTPYKPTVKKLNVEPKDSKFKISEEQGKKDIAKQTELVKKGNLEKKKRDEELVKRLKRGDDTVTYKGKGSPLPSGNPSVNLRGFTQVWKAAGFKVIDGTKEPPIIEEFSELPKQKELALDLGLDEEDQETLYAEFISEYKDILRGTKTLDDVEETMDEDAYRLFRFMKDKNILDSTDEIFEFKQSLKPKKKKGKK